jgi:hypothetical protein
MSCTYRILEISSGYTSGQSGSSLNAYTQSKNREGTGKGTDVRIGSADKISRFFRYLPTAEVVSALVDPV